MKEKMIECIKYFPLNKGNCLGFATIYVPKWDLQIFNLSLHQKDGKRWVNFPSRSTTTPEGKTEYYPYFRFKDPSNYQKFCEEVKMAIEVKAAADNKTEEIDDSECPF